MKCLIDGCEKQAIARGWCEKHYNRWYKHGNPEFRERLRGETPEVRFWSKVKRDNDGCWEWQAGKNHDGYGIFHVGNDVIGAHRFSWELSNGPIPDAGKILHSCDNPSCVRPEHLWLGSQADNIADMVAKGRQRSGGDRVPIEKHVRGSKHYMAKLTEDDVRNIRKRYATGHVIQQTLADEYGVKQAVISAIVLRKTWRHA